MALLKPNIEERPPVPPGTYPAKIIGAELKNSKKGDQMVSWKLSLVGPRGVDGRWVYHNTMLSGPGSGYLRDFLRAAGNTGYNGEEFDPDTYLGSFVTLTVEKNFDQMRNELPFPKVMAVGPCENPPAPTGGPDFNADDIPF